MNSQLFVPYNIAFKMKTLGFNDHCFAFYDERKTLCYHEKPYAFWTKNSEVKLNHTFFRKGKENICAAPLWSQYIIWLRNNYKIYLSVIPIRETFQEKVRWKSSVVLDDVFLIDTINIIFDTYEQAIFNAGVWALELINKRPSYIDEILNKNNAN